MFSTKKRRFGITLRLAMLAWLITIVTVSIFVMVIIPEQKRIFISDLNSKAKAVAVLLHDAATSAVVNDDYATLVEKCLEAVKEDKSLEYLVITKNSGESWIHEKTGWRFTSLPTAWHPGIRETSGEIGFVPEFDRRVFHYSTPFDYSSIRWGWIHVGLSLDTYDRSVEGVYRRTGLLAIVCILISLVASAIYARLFVKPIRNLQFVVHRLAQGDMSARAQIETSDEIGLLAGSFNTMAACLLQRDNILGSVQFASQQFFGASDWRSVAKEVLIRIGSAANVTRAYICENHTEANGGMHASEQFEYAATPETLLINSPEEQKFVWYGAGLELWAERLEKGMVYTGVISKMLPAERAFLSPQKTKSIILVPVRIEGSWWWGHVGFEDCSRERGWTDPEMDSLRALADMLGAAITRQRAQEALLEAKQTLEQRVNERTRELQEQVVAKQTALAELAETQQELIVASREAGMAEVATGVLHNVGNVLNSVNVSTTHIRERLERSEIATLGKLRDLLLQHKDDSGTFLTSDPRGKLVPGFIIQLSEQLTKEQAALQKDHDQLASNVEHIKEIVAMQQSYAKVSGFVERISISNLMEDALQMNYAGLARHGIKLVRKYSEVPPVFADKHKILQILVNLVHNAKYALDGARTEDKTMTVEIRLQGADRVLVMVQDNGVGISPENLTRIFSHGFTTRPNGHGFGLHSGANAAKEMGGQLTAHSDGPGKGALFTLELPLHGHRNN